MFLLEKIEKGISEEVIIKSQNYIIIIKDEKV